MNSIVALPIVAALPVTSPLVNPPSDRRALEAYASWLLMERRILCNELWPDMGAKAERYDYYDNAGAGWHFRGDGDWRDLPQPSTRAAGVLDLVGVDWRQPKPEMGIDHEDSGERPALPAGWPRVGDTSSPDAEIISAGKKLEPLLTRYVTAKLEWAKLNRADHAEANAKFGADYTSDAWSKPNPGTSPATKFLTKVSKRNGCDRADEELSAIHEEMDPLANLIRYTPTETVAGLRAKTLVAIWDCLPLGADHQGCFSFDNDDDSYRSLFHAAAALTGLSDMTSAIDIQLQIDAGIPQDGE
jgi:hypothetical protein